MELKVRKVKLFNMRMTEERYQAFSDYCKSQGKTMTQVIEEMIAERLDKKDK